MRLRRSSTRWFFMGAIGLLARPAPAQVPAETLQAIQNAGAASGAPSALAKAAGKAAGALSGREGGAAPAKGAVAGVGAAGAASSDSDRLAALRKKVLTDDDFVEDDETNRDPFRSYLRLFVEKSAPEPQAVPAVFDKFALEELALIAIVSGDATPRAMFRDPGGLGQTVRRGDYLSKTGARVSKILSDRVIVEMSENLVGGEAKVTERAILVNPEGSLK